MTARGPSPLRIRAARRRIAIPSSHRRRPPAAARHRNIRSRDASPMRGNRSSSLMRPSLRSLSSGRAALGSAAHGVEQPFRRKSFRGEKSEFRGKPRRKVGLLVGAQHGPAERPKAARPRRRLGNPAELLDDSSHGDSLSIDRRDAAVLAFSGCVFAFGERAPRHMNINFSPLSAKNLVWPTVFRRRPSRSRPGRIADPGGSESVWRAVESASAGN